nr:glycine-rich cell wall structural protein 1.8 [Ipomoea batatas]
MWIWRHQRENRKKSDEKVEPNQSLPLRPPVSDSVTQNQVPRDTLLASSLSRNHEMPNIALQPASREQPGGRQNADQRMPALVNPQKRSASSFGQHKNTNPTLTSHHIASELNNLNLGPADTDPPCVLESVCELVHSYCPVEGKEVSVLQKPKAMEGMTASSHSTSTQHRATMDGYRKVEKQKLKSPLSENEIRVASHGLVRNYFYYATTLLSDVNPYTIELQKRFPGLHQDTAISSVSITDVWEPIDEVGLETVEKTYHVSMISITLSEKELNKNSPGYQAPSHAEQGQQYNNNYLSQQPYRQSHEVYSSDNEGKGPNLTAQRKELKCELVKLLLIVFTKISFALVRFLWSRNGCGRGKGCGLNIGGYGNYQGNHPGNCKVICYVSADEERVLERPKLILATPEGEEVRMMILNCVILEEDPDKPVKVVNEKVGQ